MANGIRYSVNPSGERFPIPQEKDYELEKQRIGRLVEAARSEGKEIVVVMGVGFVGAVMAAIVADTVDAAGNPSKFVIGCQRPSQRSYWKIPMLNRGESPVKAEDPEVDRIISRCVKDRKTLTASFNSDVLEYADVVVVDVQCDFSKQDLGYMKSGEADMAALEATLKTIGEKIPPHCLTLIETTVAPGTTEFVAWPILKKAFAKRGIESVPLLAHSFERVMPGREYVSSIRDFWRVCSGCEAEARKRVEKFLHEVLNTKDFPLTVMDRPIESETTKIVENSYRATILAYLNEWSLFAERNGVDLIKVINAIKMRPTHSNIIFPGPGVGGGIVCQRTEALAIGHTGIFSDLRMVTKFLKSPPPPSTSTIPVRCMWLNLPVTPCAIWPVTLPARKWCFAGRATGRMSGIPVTAEVKWWCANSPKWGRRYASMIPTWSIGTNWSRRILIRPPDYRGAVSSATRNT